MGTTQSQQPAGPTRPFSVKDCALVALATGRKARLLQELKSSLSDVDAASIFLITRHLREYLTLMLALTNGAKERIELA